jgi:hypothetical protein
VFTDIPTGNVPGTVGKALSAGFHMPVDGVDILDDVGFGANGKARALVYRTEGAVVPGAVAGHPDQQAAGFAGRPDGALFKPVVAVRIMASRWVMVNGLLSASD